MTQPYPDTYKSDHVDEYFGHKVPDPYRWLEDDRSEDTHAWVKAQNAITQQYLNQIPYRDQIKADYRSMYDFEKYSRPFIQGDYVYFYKNEGLQQHYVLYRQKHDEAPEVFLDPNTFSEDGSTSLAGVSFSDDGTRCAYAISEGGTDWRKIITIRTDDKTPIGEPLEHVKFSGIAWQGEEGFYYSRYDQPTEGSELSGKTALHKVYYHKVGESQDRDELIMGGEAMPRRYIWASTTENSELLVIQAAQSTFGNELYIKDLRNKDAEFIKILDGFKTEAQLIDYKDDTLYIRTNLDAPNYRLVKAPLSHPDTAHWTDVIPESEHVFDASTIGGYIFTSQSVDVTDRITQYDYSGRKIRSVDLPGLGSVAGFSGKQKDTVVYYSFTNFIYPNTIFRYDLETGESTRYIRPDIDFEPSDYVSQQVFYTSKDGTRIPMFITHHKDITLDGQNPTILYGYGGFNVSLKPHFSMSYALWMKYGGVYAVANLRGGGEYGTEWHDAGRQMNKQNVFDDFIAAAQYLQEKQYTSPSKLALRGGSNGGLLVGAVMTQAPNLAAVALPAVGVLDMLRYHSFTAGAGWAYDYGTSADSEAMFQYLYGYSPLHNIASNTCYPATLITTADHDDRVVPAHSFKFAATLQDKQSCDKPTLIRIETKAGHGAGKSTDVIIQEMADILGFTLWNMGINTLPQKE